MYATIESGWVGKGQLQSWLIGQRAADSEEFVLAVLRDIYWSEADIARWLAVPRQEFDGRSARDLMRTHRALEVELLVVREWNRQERIR